MDKKYVETYSPSNAAAKTSRKWYNCKQTHNSIEKKINLIDNSKPKDWLS